MNNLKDNFMKIRKDYRIIRIIQQLHIINKKVKNAFK